MHEKFTQDFITSRRNYNDGTTRLGQLGRLWYDSLTNTIRIGDGTPGGRVVSADSTGGTITVKDEGTTISSAVSSLNFVGNGVFLNSDSSGEIEINVIVPTMQWDGGTPTTDFSIGFGIDAGSVT